MDGIFNLHLWAVSLLQEGLSVFGVLADGSCLPAVVGAGGIQLHQVRSSLIIASHQDRYTEGPIASGLSLLLDVVRRLSALRGDRDGFLVGHPVFLDELAGLLTEQSEVRAEAGVHSTDMIAQKLGLVNGGLIHQG